MSSQPVLILTYAAALSATAVGGMFYAFSTFTMRGLDRTEPTTALTAMRGINAEAQSSAAFLAVFLGSAVLAVAVAVVALVQLGRPGSAYLLIGAALSVSTLVVTVACNVPLNDRLAALDPAGLSAGEAVTQWAAYHGPWTRWNHVRTVTSLLGGALLFAGAHFQ
jgi:uncharacterized membrane protein